MKSNQGEYLDTRLDWRKSESYRSGVKVEVETQLDRVLPEVYDPVFQQKCDQVFQHIFDSYQDREHNAYRA